MTRESPAWRADPLGRHQYRYWDGAKWTDKVADNGLQGVDAPAAAWLPDPFGRHQHRYWDGANWTDHISDGGKQGIDPPTIQPPSQPLSPPMSTIQAMPSSPASAGQRLSHAAQDGEVSAESELARGRVLEDGGNDQEAETAYRSADALGSDEGAFLLGLMLRHRGDAAGAEDAYSRAAQRGNARASCNLAVLLEERGDIAGAEAAYRRADAQDFAGGAYGLGQLLYARDDLEGALAAMTRADALGDADAAYNLGFLLKQGGDLDGAEAAYRRADEGGNASGSTALGKLLEARGDDVGAEAAFRRADAVGDPMGSFDLAGLLSRLDDELGAMAALTRAAERGYPGAAEALALLELPADEGSSLPDATQAGEHKPDAQALAREALAYVAACDSVLKALDATLEVANRAVGARSMASQRPQHEISVRNFTAFAVKEEAAFVPLYKAFAAVCDDSRKAAANFLAACAAAGSDPELILLVTVADDAGKIGDAYNRTSVAAHLLRANFVATPSGFTNALESANHAIQADIFDWGEEGFIAHVFAPTPPPQASERQCPWCAEMIKPAAIICRFCGRDVTPTA